MLHHLGALAGAPGNVQDSLRRFATDSNKMLDALVIISNVTLGVNRPEDAGVAVWFTWDGLQVCVAIDRYLAVEGCRPSTTSSEGVEDMKVLTLKPGDFRPEGMRGYARQQARFRLLLIRSPERHCAVRFNCRLHACIGDASRTVVAVPMNLVKCRVGLRGLDSGEAVLVKTFSPL